MVVNRQKFITTCMKCSVGLLVAPAWLQSCAGTAYLTASIEGNNLSIPLTSFEIVNNDKKEFRKYVVVQHESLKFPICVYRVTAEKYHALWMECTHQGTELQVFGARLQCPAHGSEFTLTGDVQNGPADRPLRTFTTLLTEQTLYIKLQ
jgi:Rieske Fe-S protein